MNNFELIVQLVSLALITIAGPLVIGLLFIKQGNL
uniref:Photosystem II reaction center protein Psb30 n=1 Tax=Lepocinclis tripteris TaxID=135494 RepID=A0A3G3LL68_9EUGL|nr:photosystem II reaction center protein [Lepocinclis tripteris]AYQ93395.1 photosystem II reaction center protein [Lepocinclis tripteris]AYQ93456.1 photosystem II reaction center protein [Lepocinclis tripteris]